MKKPAGLVFLIVSKLVIYSFAKVNLFLKILNKRPDNYHNLDTLFERISLSDRITLSSRKDNLIKIYCNNAQVPLGQDNLCWQAARLLQKKFRPHKGLDIKINKRIPVGAGLGGGSSNAASVLTGLNKFWGLKLSKTKLVKFAVALGSDVPFFIHAIPFAYGLGRGEKIQALPGLNRFRLWHILVVPEKHLSTPLVYREWDAGEQSGRIFSGLTKPAVNVKILTSILAKKNPRFRPGLLFNSLEQVSLRLCPEIKRVKTRLRNQGLENILMSGSGPAVFAIACSGYQARSIAARLKQEGEPGRVFAVSTV